MMPLDKLFEKIRHEINKLFKQNLVSVLVYGSAAADDMQPGVSDVNILVIVNQLDLDDLDRLRKIIKSYHKHGVTTPLVMTLNEINQATHLFPMEFLEIKEKHKMLQGDDVFAGLEIETKGLHQQCQHEVRTRLQQVRQNYFKMGDKVKELKELIIESHQVNFPIYRTVLRLKGTMPPLKKDEVIHELCTAFDMNKEIFLKLKLLRQGELKLTLPTLKTLLSDYLGELDKIVATLDQNQ